MPPLMPYPWEMTPRYRLLDSAPCALSCAGANRWQLHLVKLPSWDYSFLWMRPLDIESDAGFTLFDANFHRDHIFGGTETLQSLSEQIEQSIGNEMLARRFVLNTRGELRQGNQRAHEILSVTRDGVARWNDRDNHHNTPFRWRVEAPLTRAQFVALPAARVWSELQQLLADPDGEAAFAREFARLDSQQRDARIQRPRRGTLGELNGVLHQLLLATAPWESAGDDELFVSFTRRDDARLWQIGRNNPDEIDVPAAMREGVQQLWDRFEPFALIDANYLCAQNINASAASLFARAYRPSAHERLEAQLQLRDWQYNSLQTT